MINEETDCSISSAGILSEEVLMLDLFAVVASLGALESAESRMAIAREGGSLWNLFRL